MRYSAIPDGRSQGGREELVGEPESYSHLYVIGFAIQPVARTLVDNCEAVAGVPSRVM